MAEQVEDPQIAADEPPAGAQVADTKAADLPPQDDSDDGDDLTPESLASELGWAPKDNWRGNEEDWKDAKSFLRDTVEINKTTRRELKATREAADRAARAAAAITEQALERQRIELLQRRQEAFDAGDAQTFSTVEQRLATLPQPEIPARSAETQDFIRRNSTWYGIDPIATQIAYNVCEQYKTRPYAEQLQEAEKVIRQRFPEYAPRTNKGPAALEAGATRATATVRKGPKGFNDLPPDARRAALDYEKRGRATREEYAKIYFEEQA